MISLEHFLLLALATSLAIMGWRAVSDEGKLFHPIRDWAEDLVKYGLPSIQKLYRERTAYYNKLIVELGARYSEGEFDVDTYRAGKEAYERARDSELKLIGMKQDRQCRILKFFLNPILLCPTCMASFWGALSFVLYSLWNSLSLPMLNAPILIPFVLCVAFINTILNDIYEAFSK